MIIKRIAKGWYMASMRTSNGAIAIGYGNKIATAVKDCERDIAVIYKLNAQQ